jgi:thiol-disulfide isomerase/thioredoxin
MNRLIHSISLTLAIICVVATLNAAQNASSPAGGLELLQRASQEYANAKSYHIQMVEEVSTHSEFQRNWTRTLLDAAEGSGNQFRYEGRTGLGTELRVSDGINVWTYIANDHIYTQRSSAPTPAGTPTFVGSLEIQTVQRAKNLRNDLAELRSKYRSAIRLPDQTVKLNGRLASCYVIRVGLADMKRSTDDSYEETIWIDKSNDVFVQRKARRHRLVYTGDAHFPQDMEVTTTYPFTVLNVELRGALFKFVPPVAAQRVDEFPKMFETGGGPSLKGQLLPEFMLADTEGKSIPTSSLRGRVVVLDIWATWCPPCLRGLEQLSKIYGDNHDKGLVLITIDEDEEPTTAQEFLEKKSYAWANIHDDGRITKALGGTEAVPRTLIIDRDGKVVYDSGSGSEDMIRGILAEIDPAFAGRQ